MSAFGGMIQTTKGSNLQAKALTGVEIHFTRIAIGDGELNSSSITDLNALKHEVKSLEIKKLKTSGEQAIVGTVLSSQDVSTGFYWREIGLFAQDPNEGEILYCYGNAGTSAEYIPAYGGPDVIEKTIDVVSIVGNAQNVSATINSLLTYATLEDLQDLDDRLTTVIETKETPEGAQAKADTARNAAQAYADSKVAELINSAPEALDTLKELADAMGGDPNLKENLINMIAGKANQSDFDSHKNESAILAPQTGSTANAIVLNWTAEQNKKGSFMATADNTGNMTINGKPFLKQGGTIIPAAGVKTGKVYDFYYDIGSGGRFFLLARATGTVTPDKVLAGETFSTESGSDQVGTRDESQLLPENIKKGVTIAGVTGNILEFGTGDIIPPNKLTASTRSLKYSITIAGTEVFQDCEVIDNGYTVLTTLINGAVGGYVRIYDSAGSLWKTFSYTGPLRVSCAIVDGAMHYLYVSLFDVSYVTASSIYKIDLTAGNTLTTANAVASRTYTSGNQQCTDLKIFFCKLYACVSNRGVSMLDQTTLGDLYTGYACNELITDGTYLYSSCEGESVNIFYKYDSLLNPISSLSVFYYSGGLYVSRDGIRCCYCCNPNGNGARYIYTALFPSVNQAANSLYLDSSSGSAGCWMDDDSSILGASTTSSRYLSEFPFCQANAVTAIESYAVKKVRRNQNNKYCYWAAAYSLVKIAAYEQTLN